MTAYDKLDAADFFLTKMKGISVEHQDFGYYLGAFLCEARSVIDHLLYDYAKAYKLGIGEDDYLDIQIFIERSKQTSNADAQNFISWYEQGVSSLDNHSIAGPLNKLRNMHVHRDQPELKWIVEVTITATVSSTLETYVSRNGRVVPGSYHKQEQAEQDTPKEKVTIQAYFTKYLGLDVITACDSYIQLMRDVVSEGLAKFPAGIAL